MPELILYTTEDGQTSIKLRAEDGTVWLSQQEMAELFATSIPNINQHVRKILAEGEQTEATIKSCLIVQDEGSRSVRRKTMMYSLPLILAVGYRVRSARGTQFRQWATRHLNEFLVKGFVMDDVRLKASACWMPFSASTSVTCSATPASCAPWKTFALGARARKQETDRWH